MKTQTFIIAFFSLISLSLNAQVISQQSSNEGFSITGSLGYHSWSSEDISDGALGGFAFHISPAYGFNDHIQAYLTLEFAPAVDSGTPDIDSYPVSQMELGARFNFAATTSKLRPFVQASLSRHSLSFVDLGSTIEFSGIAFGFGGGVKYFIEPNMAIQTLIQYDGGEYTNNNVDGFKIDQSFDMSTLRFSVGFVYLFEG